MRLSLGIIKWGSSETSYYFPNRQTEKIKMTKYLIMYYSLNYIIPYYQSELYYFQSRFYLG